MSFTDSKNMVEPLHTQKNRIYTIVQSEAGVHRFCVCVCKNGGGLGLCGYNYSACTLTASEGPGGASQTDKQTTVE